jgi:hypothetical protein
MRDAWYLTKWYTWRHCAKKRSALGFPAFAVLEVRLTTLARH